MSVKVTLRIPEHRQRSVTLPDDIPLSRLVPALANKLKMPFTAQGQTITYSLYHENSQTTIAPQLTLAEAGVQAGDSIVLQETRGETAVTEPILNAAQDEAKAKPAPQPKKRGMSTTIKVIIGAFILLILCACITPFFFMYTAFSQFSANVPDAFPLSNITNRLDSGVKPDVAWQFPVADTIMAAPAVDNGVVYFGVLSSSSPDFYAVDATTGEALWQFTADEAISWTPALTQDKVFFSTDGGYFYALDRATGTEQWQFTPAQRNLSPGCSPCSLKFRYPVVADGVVYVGSLDSHLYALDAATGAEKWRFSTPGSVLDKPVIVDGIVYFGTGEGLFYAVDAETGDQIYRVRTANVNTQKLYDPVAVSGPIVEGNRVYITNGGATALERQTGEQLWRFISPNEWGYISKRPLADNQHIYVMDRQVTIYALDKYDGSVVWTYDYPDDYIYGEMILDNGLIYFGDGNGRLVAIDAQTGKPHTIYNLNKHQTISSYEVSDFVFTPAIHSGTAYLGWANQMNAIQLETP